MSTIGDLVKLLGASNQVQYLSHYVRKLAIIDIIVVVPFF